MAGTLQACVGRLGQGKSYDGVVNATRALSKGQTVYSSFLVAYGEDTPGRVIEAVGPGEWRQVEHARTGRLRGSSIRSA